MADTVKVGPWGAPDGQARDVNIGSRPQRLKTITISCGGDSGNNGRITGISFVYVDQNDLPVFVGPWGKMDSDHSKTIEMMQEERLNCVSGTFYESAITSLELISNKQRHSFGHRAGRAFSVLLPQDDAEGVAFFGRSDDILKALGVYVLEKNGLPVMIGPWGGSGGTPVDIITRPVELKSVTVYSIQRINGFSFTYVEQNGNSIATATWGTTSGGKQTFDLNQGEYVNNIFGSFDDNGVNSLQFTTTNNEKHGPYGRLSGTVFSVPLPDKAVVGNQNGAVVGFFGRSGGDGLVALGVYVGREAPNVEP